jgi:hypothetical protein
MLKPCKYVSGCCKIVCLYQFLVGLFVTPVGVMSGEEQGNPISFISLTVFAVIGVL